MGLPFLCTTIVLTPLGGEVPETAGSDRVVMYLLSPASDSGASVFLVVEVATSGSVAEFVSRALPAIA